MSTPSLPSPSLPASSQNSAKQSLCFISLRSGSSSPGNEKGLALFETALLTLCLSLFLVGVLDITRALRLHMTLSRVAFEAVRCASLTPGLTPGSSSTSAAPEPSHAPVYARVNEIAGKYGVNASLNSSVERFNSSIQKNRFAGDVTTADVKKVKVLVRSDFEPYLPLLNSITEIRAGEEGPYLFQ